MFGLFSERREHEAGIASNRILEWYGEAISNLVHTARHAMVAFYVRNVHYVYYF